MAYREFHYRWEWRLRSSPEALWPFVSDTDRFNRDTGVPAVEMRAADKPSANARRRLRLTRFGVPIEWEEEPFEWVRPYRFGVLRNYSRGPVAELRTVAEMMPQPGGTRLAYDVWARPRNLFGFIAIPAQVGVLSYYGADKAFRQYDQEAAKAKPSAVELPASRVEFAPGGKERLVKLREVLINNSISKDVVDLLVELIEQADDLALFRIRPYALADFWEKSRREVLTTCLQAVRAGLLDFQWDLLCPLCRGPKDSSDTLGGISPQVHCDSCNIDFTANFDRSVELTFRPNPAVRPCVPFQFCVGGPQITPHIVAQQLLTPGERRELSLPLDEGRYRLRTLELRGGQSLAANDQGQPNVTFQATDSGWSSDEVLLSLAPTLSLENSTPKEQLFILERTAWNDQAVTAAEVTTLQVFRDLFANEALRPGEKISVGSLTVLFTDLRGSTRLYREDGDAVAFGRVMDHFDILKQAIAAEDGAIVKTIGDAVMAAFRRPVAALRAALRAQKMLAAPPPSSRLPALQLKAGIHTGSCVAVTLNDRLDYFGSTVNIAARLEGLSSERDGVVISAAVHADPEVQAWLAEGNLKAEPFEAELKGFEGEKFELWVVKE